MKRFFTFLTVCVLASSVLSGCDAFRSLAGRPTSAQIEAKRARMEADIANRRHIQDSIAVARLMLEDSLAVADSLAESTRDGSFYIVVGTFASPQNAEKMAGQARAAGYPPKLKKYSNGKTSVLLCPCGTEKEALAALEKLRKEKFCPAEAWILEDK